MSINLSIRFQHPDAISNAVRFSRIDNTTTPVWTNVQPNPVTSPATIATNIPNGQYAVGITAVYADGRSCSEEVTYTPPCPNMISVSGYISGSNIVVQYLAPSSVANVLINIGYPNGGSFSQIYVNTGTPISVGIPSGLSGNFTISAQAVCDAVSGFYGPPSATATVTYNPNNLLITSDAAGIVINTLTGIAGFTLPNNITVGSSIAGTHTAFYGTITFTWTGTPATNLNATLSINGTVVQCVNIPNTAGGTLSFPSVSVAATDQFEIDFNTGLCP